MHGKVGLLTDTRTQLQLNKNTQELFTKKKTQRYPISNLLKFVSPFITIHYLWTVILAQMLSNGTGVPTRGSIITIHPPSSSQLYFSQTQPMAPSLNNTCTLHLEFHLIEFPLWQQIYHGKLVVYIYTSRLFCQLILLKCHCLGWWSSFKWIWQRQMCVSSLQTAEPMSFWYIVAIYDWKSQVDTGERMFEKRWVKSL